MTGSTQGDRAGTDTRRLLHESLDLQRDVVVWKVAGLVKPLASVQ